MDRTLTMVDKDISREIQRTAKRNKIKIIQRSKSAKYKNHKMEKQ